MAVADFNRFHIVRLRDESQVSICMAWANARAVMTSLARMAALVAGLVRVTVLVEEFI